MDITWNGGTMKNPRMEWKITGTEIKNQNPEGMNMGKLSGVLVLMRSIVSMKQTGNFQVWSSTVTKTVKWRGKIQK